MLFLVRSTFYINIDHISKWSGKNIQKIVWAPIGGERDREWREWREWRTDGGRRGRGRQLPPTPSKPSTLHIKQPNFALPRLNTSPSHVSVRPWVGY